MFMGGVGISPANSNLKTAVLFVLKGLLTNRTDQASMEIERQPLTKLVRVLCSEEQEGFREVFTHFVHQAADDGISVALLVPPTICEIDLLELAAGQRWDLAILFLNNIKYPSNDRTPEGIVGDAANLIRTMKRLFNKPIVCFYGATATVELLNELIEAGPNSLFLSPTKPSEVVPVLRSLLDEVPGL